MCKHTGKIALDMQLQLNSQKKIMVGLDSYYVVSYLTINFPMHHFFHAIYIQRNGEEYC